MVSFRLSLVAFFNVYFKVINRLGLITPFNFNCELISAFLGRHPVLGHRVGLGLGFLGLLGLHELGFSLLELLQHVQLLVLNHWLLSGHACLFYRNIGQILAANFLRLNLGIRFDVFQIVFTIRDHESSVF
jgi:hypothetical protein